MVTVFLLYIYIYIKTATVSQMTQHINPYVGEYVDRLCGCKINGSRVVQSDKHQVAVYDLLEWSEDMTQCVKTKYPGARVSMFHSSSSLTGFIVVIETAVVATMPCASIVSFFTLLCLGAALFYFYVLGPNYTIFFW